MNQTEAIETIQSEAFGFQFVEHVEALAALSGITEERGSLSKQYKFLEFVADQYPDAVMEYLAREPDHFAGLARQTTDTGMAMYVRQVADRIYGYSIVGKVLGDLAQRMRKPAEGNIIDSLITLAQARSAGEQAEEAEQNEGTN